MKSYYIIVNKVHGKDDLAFVKRFFTGDDIIGMIPYSEDIVKSGRADNGIRIEDIEPINSIRHKLIKGVMNG